MVRVDGKPKMVPECYLGTPRKSRRAPVGTYLALAALNRVVVPTAKAGFGDWWNATAAFGTRCATSPWSDSR